MLRFFHTTDCTVFLDIFHPDSPDLFNLNSRFMAIAPRPIYFLSFLGLKLRNGERRASP